MKTNAEIRRENLRRLVDQHGGATAFAAKIERLPAQVSQWLNASIDYKSGKPRQISDKSARMIESSLGLQTGWLDLDHTALIHPGAGVRAWETPDDLDPDVYGTIPHYDVKLSAGDGAIAEWVRHEDNDPLAFRRRFFQARRLNPKHLKALYVRGTSMEPTLEDGDTVVIDTSQTQIQDDEIYALLYCGELYVKRLFRMPGGGIEVRSDNPKHRSWEVTGPDLEHLLVLGKKVWRGG